MKQTHLNKFGLLLLGLLVSCHVVRPVPVEFVIQNNPPTVWITYTDGSFAPVAGPAIHNDSLFGTWQGLGEPFAASLTEIQTIQTRIPAPKRTVLLFTTLTVSVFGVVYTIATAGNGGDPDFMGCPRRKGTPLPDCEQD